MKNNNKYSIKYPLILHLNNDNDDSMMWSMVQSVLFGWCDVWCWCDDDDDDDVSDEKKRIAMNQRTTKKHKTKQITQNRNETS